MPTFPSLAQRPDFQADPFGVPALQNAMRYKQKMNSTDRIRQQQEERKAQAAGPFGAMAPAGSMGTPQPGMNPTAPKEPNV